jgi:hypothetical protein
MTLTPTFPWNDDPEVRQAQYNAELVDRYQKGLPLTEAGKRDARRLIRAASKQVAA